MVHPRSGATREHIETVSDDQNDGQTVSASKSRQRAHVLSSSDEEDEVGSQNQQVSTMDYHAGRSQWSSGSMPDCSARGPGIESHCRQLCLS